MADETYDPKKFVPADEDFDPNRFVVAGESQTAPMATQRGYVPGKAANDAKEFALGALPAIGAAGAVALSGPAAPLTVTALAALAGGYAGKGVEMGLRTGTGVGAETVPPTFAGRQLAGLNAGAEQAKYELGVGYAFKVAEKVARASIRHAERSQLFSALRQEQKLAIQKQRATDDFERMLSKNDEEIAGIDKALEDLQVATGQAGTAKRASMESQRDSLIARKRYLEQQATEEAFRVAKVEAAAKGVDAALAATGAGVPGVGMTAQAHATQMEGLVHQFTRDRIQNMGGAYVGLRDEAMKRAPAPVDVRPLFKRVADEINKIPQLPGTGRNLTEINEILLGIKKDYSEFSKGKPAVVRPASAADALMGKTQKVVKEATPAVDEGASLAAVLEMQGNLSQEIAKLQSKGPSGERTAKVLRVLQEDTAKFIEKEMERQGWQEGPALLKAVRNQWAADSSYMEQQAFQLLKKDPGRAHELLTADSGYAPVLKKVLKDTNGYDVAWPEIRRRWIESNFVRNGKLDFTAFVEAARREQPIIGTIFDTPQAKAQFQRLHLASLKMEVLEGKAFKSVAGQAKVEALHREMQSIGEEMAAIDARIPQEMAEIFNSSKGPQAELQRRLSQAKGYKREALKEAFERKTADIAAKQNELGLLQKGVGRDLLGPVPRILAYRGASGLVGGGMAGLAMGGGGSIEGAIGAGMGLTAGLVISKADEALVKKMVKMADDPHAMSQMMRILDSWEKGLAPKVAQALRLSVLGYTGSQQAVQLMSSH